MRRHVAAALGGLLATAGISVAQPPSDLPATAGIAVVNPSQQASAGCSTQQPTVAMCDDSCSGPSRCDPRTWGSVEYLLWWTRPGPVSVPLVNSQRLPLDLARSFEAGGLADPNTFVIFGNQDINYGTSVGVRLSSGLWLNQDQTVGVGGYIFTTEQRSNGTAFNSDANGNPALILLANSVTPGFTGETGGVFAGPFGAENLVGSIGIRSTSRLAGTETNLLGKLWHTDHVSVSAIGGVKYMQLEEDLEIFATLLNSTRGTTADNFTCRNRFLGAQLGAAVAANYGKFSMLGTARCALGGTEQELTITGASITPTNLGAVAGPGGFYALSSNSGRTETTRFGVVPELGMNLSYHVTDSIFLTTGYTFLYWTNVLRPGDQIDRNINFNLTPGFGGGPGGVGPQSPARRNQETDFWAHGVSFGLGITF